MGLLEFAALFNPVTAPIVIGREVVERVGGAVGSATDDFIADKGEHAGEGFGRGAVRGAHAELRTIVGDYARAGRDLVDGLFGGPDDDGPGLAARLADAGRRLVSG